MNKMGYPKIMGNRNGLSLLEVMVALLLLAITTSMIYSMLNRSIFFADKGESKTAAIEEQYALVSLLQRQVQSGWYDPRTKKVVIAGEENFLRLATAIPFQARPGQVVMAFYRYNPEEKTLYYLEKKDFYNADYAELVPDYSEMTALLTTTRALNLGYDEEGTTVTLDFGGHTYEFQPWCTATLTEVGDG